MRTWLARGAFVLISVIALELTARFEDWVRFRTPLLSPYRSQTDLAVRDALGMHGRPGGRFQKWVLNDLGTRGPAATELPGPGVFRIVTVGASETFGLYESPDREFPRQLEDSLNASLARGACGAGGITRFEVLNAAFPGMSLPTVEQDVRLRLARFGPSMVVLYPTPAQYLSDARPRPAVPDTGAGPDAGTYLRAMHPRAFDRFREQAKLLLPSFMQDWLRARHIEASLRGRPAEWRFASVPANRLRAFRGDLAAFVETVRAIGADPVLATHANAFAGQTPPDPILMRQWERFYPRATGETIIAFDSAAGLEIRRVAETTGVPLADLWSELSGESTYFADYAHFTDTGAAMVAGRVHNVILAALHAAGRCGSGDAGPAPVRLIRQGGS